MAFLCALLLSLTCQGQNPAALELKEVIQRAKLNDSLVKSGLSFFMVEEESLMPSWKLFPQHCDETLCWWTVLYAFKEGKFCFKHALFSWSRPYPWLRFDLLPHPYPFIKGLEVISVGYYVFDGKDKTWEMKARGYPYNIQSWGISIYGEPIGNFLERQDNAELIRQEEIKGETCYVVQIVPADLNVILWTPGGLERGGLEREIKVWLNPLRGYRVQKMEDRTERFLFVYQVDLKNYLGDIWFPKGILTEVYDREGLKLLMRRRITVFENFINVDIPELLFEGYLTYDLTNLYLQLRGPLGTAVQGKSWGSIKAMFR